ncbi:MAG: calcium-binding protein [Planctomycetota bacterium]
MKLPQYRIASTALVGSMVGVALTGHARAQRTASPLDAMTRVSVDSAGNQSNNQSQFWNNQTISADGRYVVFLSYATKLVPGDTNSVPDVFVHDRATGETTRVNLSSTGHQANDFSGGGVISADGRYVALDSYANNIVSGDTNSASDVFVHDCSTGGTSRVSIDSAGNAGNYDSWRPSISADGRYVAFNSLATNLVANDTNNARDVFVHDRLTAVTTRVSVDSAGSQGDGDSGYYSSPSLSADGRYVAFDSLATNLITGRTTKEMHVFVHDLLTGLTELASVSSTGRDGNSWSWYPSLSHDGRYVAFTSGATNLVSGDLNQVNDVFVHDRNTGHTTIVSVSSDGTQGDFSSLCPSLSDDGRYVSFSSSSSTLAPHTACCSNVFLHDRVIGATWLMSTASTNTDSATVLWSEPWSDVPSISADGRFVTFESWHSSLVADDTNHTIDIFVTGPDLTLNANLPTVVPGQTLTLIEYSGMLGTPASLWAVDANGLSISVLLAAGTFAADGSFVISGVVPPGIGPLEVVFRGYALGQSDCVHWTNPVTILFR